MFRGRSKGERARREQARCLANMAHIRQSKPDSGLGYQVKLLILFQVVPSSLESGYRDRLDKKDGDACGVRAVERGEGAGRGAPPSEKVTT